MSKYFGFVDGKAYDFEFKKHHYPNWKLFYLGEHLIATLIKLEHKAGWGVIVNHVKTRDVYNRDRALVIHEKEYFSKKEKADV